ncbi:MAG: hypothetical protein JWO46_2873, partial [Nocardioidaceae bacterium]|nr:hypothetical protein [Nocardioidaceae bacterium]
RLLESPPTDETWGYSDNLKPPADK